MRMNLSVDVLVVGGGPVGLLIAYQLVRAGCTVHIVDKDNKTNSNQYGRANAIYARTAELLDQLGLAEGLVQQCHIVRESYTYNEKGERVIPGRVWNFVENIDDTKYELIGWRFLDLNNGSDDIGLGSISESCFGSNISRDTSETVLQNLA